MQICTYPVRAEWDFEVGAFELHGDECNANHEHVAPAQQVTTPIQRRENENALNVFPRPSLKKQKSY